MSGRPALQLALLGPTTALTDKALETKEEALALVGVYRELPPFQRGSVPSFRAAERAQGWSPTWRVRVLAYLLTVGERGATDREIQGALEMRGSTQRPRRVELVELGLVYDTGETRDGGTVWRAVEWIGGAGR